jgi:hypothetical protein
MGVTQGVVPEEGLYKVGPASGFNKVGNLRGVG